MQKQPINKQQTIRFFNKELLDKLNEDYEKSRFSSVNNYLNFCLGQSVKFKNIQTYIFEMRDVLKELNENSKNYQNKELKLLEQFVNKMITCEKIICRIYHLLFNYVFDCELKEEKFENGSQDYMPSGLKGYLKLEQ